MSKVILGYWNFRGYGQVARLLLAYTEANWEDVTYDQSNRTESWHNKEKHSLGLEFPNLPYLIEGDFKISETHAVWVYIIDRSNKREELLGANHQERAKILNIERVVDQMEKKVTQMAYSSEPEKFREKTSEFLQQKLEYLQKFRGNKEWILGRLTLPDFLLVELSFYIEKIFPSLFKRYIFLKEEQDRFQNIPQIKKYYDQPKAIKGTFTDSEIAGIKF